jgi:predicted MFS family arabinose efflux permease
MVLVAEERLGVGPEGYALLVTAYGVGGVAGALVAERVLARVGDARYLRLAIVVETLVPLAIALTADALVVGAVFVGFGLHATVWGAVLASLRQELTPDRLRGRVGSVHLLIEYGTAAPGALLGGALAARFSLAAPFWLGAVVGAALIPFAWSAFSDANVRVARQAVDR